MKDGTFLMNFPIISEIDSDINLQDDLAQISHDMSNIRWSASPQNKYSGIINKGGVHLMERYQLPADANVIRKHFMMREMKSHGFSPIQNTV